MTEPPIIGALRDKHSELSGLVDQLERQLVQHRTDLGHLDATMQLFDPQIRPSEIRAKRRRLQSAWFRPGECLRLLYDELRDAPSPLTTRALVETVMQVKAVPATDDRQRVLLQKTVLSSLRRATETIERIEAAGIVTWRLRQAALARCQ